MDRDTVRPPLRQHVQFAADRKPRPESLQRLAEQRRLSPFDRKKEQGHGRHEGIRQRRVESVEDEVVVAGSVGLVEPSLDGTRDADVTTFARRSVIEHGAAEAAEVSPHQLGENPLYRSEILVGLDDREERVGARRQMREMIARGSHDEVEISIDFGAVAFCDHGFEGGGGLFERDPRESRVAAEFSKA